MAVFMEMNAHSKHMAFQSRRARFCSDSFVLIGQEHLFCLLSIYQILFFLSFGATAPSGPWPPHSRGF